MPDPDLEPSLGEANLVGQTIARFEILEWIGEGGEAVVYLVNDPMLRCKRALKIPKMHRLASPRDLKRFINEAARLASIDHPNVARVLEADGLGPFCFLVMEYFPEGSLARWLQQRPSGVRLAPRWVAELMVGIAKGLARTHADGLIHRDLKPGNVLLERMGESPSGPIFVPKVADFGLAKIMEKNDPRRMEDPSSMGEIMGTCLYMSPEQAKGSKDLTERSDIHALGVILYELLTGVHPYQGENSLEIRSRIINDLPVAPRALRPGLPRALQAITLKCLRKRPDERYASAEAMNDDLQRYLDGQPVHARGGQGWEHAARWMVRSVRPVSLMLGSAVLVIGLGTADQSRRDGQELQRIEQQKNQKKQAVDELEKLSQGLHVAERERQNGHYDQARTALSSTEAQIPDRTRESFVWQLLQHETRPEAVTQVPQDFQPGFALTTPDHAGIISVGTDGRVRLHSAATLKPLIELVGLKLPPNGAHAFSLDGRTFVLGTHDNKTSEYEVLFWDLDLTTPLLVGEGDGSLPKREPLAKIGGGDCSFLPLLRFLDGGRSFSVMSRSNDYRYWRFDQFERPFKGEKPRLIRSLKSTGEFLASPTGEVVAMDVDGGTDLLDARTGKVRYRLPSETVLNLDFSPDGTFLAVSTAREVRIWNVGTMTPFFSFDAIAPRTTVHFSPDNRTVALMSFGGGPVQLRDLATGRQWPLWSVNATDLQHDGVRFSPDGKWVMDRCREGADGKYRAMLWEVATGRKFYAFELFKDIESFSLAEFTPDGRSVLLIAGNSLGRHSIDPAAERQPFGHRPEAWSVAFSPDSSTLVTGGDDQTIRFWDPATGAASGEIKGHAGLVSDVAFSANGKLVVSCSLSNVDNLAITDIRAGTIGQRFGTARTPIRCAALSPDGSIVASGDYQGQVVLWDAQGKKLQSLHNRKERITRVAFSPRGDVLAAGCEDGKVYLWNVETGMMKAQFGGGNEIHSLAFHPQGHTLAWADNRGQVSLQSLDGRKIDNININHPNGSVWALAFSPGGETLAVGDEKGRIGFYCSETGRLLLTREGKSAVRCLAFAPDGSSLASCRMNGEVNIMRTKSPPDSASITPR